MAARKKASGATNAAELPVDVAVQAVMVPPPNRQYIEFDLVGATPLVINRFANKADIMGEQAKGSAGKATRKKRGPKDFNALFEAAKHMSTEGWEGINAAAFRNSAIAACRLTKVPMTTAKISVFINADGYSKEGIPLVRINGKCVRHDAAVRNQTGVVDVRARPMYKKWSCKLRVRFDGDMLTATDVTNLFARAGENVGICEGRHFSKQSAGMGWGEFRIKGMNE